MTLNISVAQCQMFFHIHIIFTGDNMMQIHLSRYVVLLVLNYSEE